MFHFLLVIYSSNVFGIILKLSMNAQSLNFKTHPRQFSDISTSYSNCLVINSNEISFALGKSSVNGNTPPSPSKACCLDNNNTITEDNDSFDDSINFISQLGNLGTLNNPQESLNMSLISNNEYSPNMNIPFPIKETKFNTGRWLQEEHQKFIEAMFLYGNEWKKVQQHIKTRSSTQARSHAQKFFIRLKKKFMEEYSEEEVKNGKNENLINLIRESVNCDLISNIFKNSGNLSQHVKSLLYRTNKESNTNGKVPEGHGISESQRTLDEIIIEKKEKFCKVVMNLLQNSCRSKKNTSRSTQWNNNSIDKVSERKFVSSDSKIKFEMTTGSDPKESPPSSTTVNNNNINSFNSPNLNNFISIVTINLGYNNSTSNQKSNLDNLCNVETQNANRKAKNSNIDCSYNITSGDQVNLNVNSTGDLRTANTDVHGQSKFQTILCNDKPTDPFKLAFEESDLGMKLFKTEENSNNDINKLNLDLDHMFNFEGH